MTHWATQPLTTGSSFVVAVGFVFVFIFALVICFIWFLVSLLNLVSFVVGGRKGRDQMWGDGDMSGIGMHDVKSTKNQ